MTTPPLLSVNDLVVQYRRPGAPPTRAVAGVSLDVAAGEVVGLVGESGCGKSTLARAVCGLTPPAAGGITFDGDEVRPLRVPGLQVLAPLAFVLATLMLFWARWPHTGEIMLLLILPMPVYLYYQHQAGWPTFDRQLRASWWLLVYLLTITALSWAGSKEFEGHDYIAYGWDQLCVAVAALFFYFWGVRSGWRTPGIEALERDAHKT